MIVSGFDYHRGGEEAWTRLAFGLAAHLHQERFGTRSAAATVWRILNGGLPGGERERGSGGSVGGSKSAFNRFDPITGDYDRACCHPHLRSGSHQQERWAASSTRAGAHTFVQTARRASAAA